MNQRPITEKSLPVIQVLVALGFIVGAAVVRLTTYSTVLEKRRELGALRPSAPSSHVASGEVVEPLAVLLGGQLTARVALLQDVPGTAGS